MTHNITFEPEHGSARLEAHGQYDFHSMILMLNDYGDDPLTV
jgi:hypothetical protein